MTLKWSNIVALALCIIGFWITLDHLPEIRAFLGTMKSIGPGHSDDEITAGLVAFGIVGAILIAIVRILTRGPGGGGES